MLRFGAAGVVGLVVDAGVLYGALLLGCGPLVGRLLSFLAAVYTTWRINRRYTFAPGTGSAWAQWWRYLGAMTGGGAFNYTVYCLVLLVLLDARAAWTPLLALACGSLAGMGVNFVSAKLLVFRQQTRHAA
jgi:putative flippase GtrA